MRLLGDPGVEAAGSPALGQTPFQPPSQPRSAAQLAAHGPRRDPRAAPESLSRGKGKSVPPEQGLRKGLSWGHFLHRAGWDGTETMVSSHMRNPGDPGSHLVPGFLP